MCHLRHPQALKAGGGNPLVDPAFDTLTFDTLFLDLQNLGRPLSGGGGLGSGRVGWTPGPGVSRPGGLPSPPPQASVPSPVC